MEISRINSYQDSRFSQKVLNQHGCFLVKGLPYEMEIVSDREAVIRGEESAVYEAVMEYYGKDKDLLDSKIISVFDLLYKEFSAELTERYKKLELFEQRKIWGSDLDADIMLW